MKIDFCPNKRKLILLSCPLQLISIDSRSPSELRSRNFGIRIKVRSFNSRNPNGLRQDVGFGVLPLFGFNSRSPSGLRHFHASTNSRPSQFQFTQPKRAATLWDSILRNVFAVSIHAAQAGCDSRTPIKSKLASSFNSRSPSGLRRLLQRYNKKEILSKDKSRKSILVIILDEEAKAIGLELTDNQPLRNSNKIMFTWDSQPNIFV